MRDIAIPAFLEAVGALLTPEELLWRHVQSTSIGLIAHVNIGGHV